MTDNNHPITPPPELRARWIIEGRSQDYCSVTEYVADQSARWGYEQRGADNEAELQKARNDQLEACCAWLDAYEAYEGQGAVQMHEDLRPKPMIQAEKALETITEMANCMAAGFIPKRSDFETIRRALKRLQELEALDD